MNNSLFIVGGQRSGTSFLRDILSQHLKIDFAKPFTPEPKFFLRESKGTYESFVSSYFQDIESDVVIAEKSTSYFEFKDALQRIKQEMVPTLIIYVVRNPVDRAISNYKFSVKNKLETRSFKEVFQLDKPKPVTKKIASTDPFDYVGRSRLSAIIPSLEKIFGDSLFLVDFNKLVEDPQSIANLVFDLLNLRRINIDLSVDKNTSFEQNISNSEKRFLSEKLSDEIAFYNELISSNRI